MLTPGNACSKNISHESIDLLSRYRARRDRVADSRLETLDIFGVSCRAGSTSNQLVTATPAAAGSAGCTPEGARDAPPHVEPEARFIGSPVLRRHRRRGRPRPRERGSGTAETCVTSIWPGKTPADAGGHVAGAQCCAVDHYCSAPQRRPVHRLASWEASTIHVSSLEKATIIRSDFDPRRCSAA